MCHIFRMLTGIQFHNGPIKSHTTTETNSNCQTATWHKSTL